MKRIVGRSAALAVTSTLALAITLSSVQAQSNCDAYARLTLQQAKENVAKNCGFKGARWSLNVNAHKQWCEDVGPAQWRIELKSRSDMLAKCKG